MYDADRSRPPTAFWDPHGPPHAPHESSLAPLLPRRTSRAGPPGPPPTTALPHPPSAGIGIASSDQDDLFAPRSESQQHSQHRMSTRMHLSTSVPLDRVAQPLSRPSTTSRRPSHSLAIHTALPATSSSSSSAHPSSASSRQHNHASLAASPPKPSTRPSSRRALIQALQLAQQAVHLDSEAEDPHAAVIAYGQSVALLSEVMDRVMIGEGTENNPSRAERSLSAREEEVRRLRSIHDTYAERMEVLCNIYNIAIPDTRAPSIPPSRPTTTDPPPLPVSSTHESKGLSQPTSFDSSTTTSGLSESAPGSDDVVASIGSTMVALTATPDDSSSILSPFILDNSHGHPSSRSSVLPPQRPPPPGPPPPKPPTPVTARPFPAPATSSSLLEPPHPFGGQHTHGHRRASSNSSNQEPIIEEEDEDPQDIAGMSRDSSPPSTPSSSTHPPHVKPSTPPASATAVPSPSTPRMEDPKPRRGTSGSISSASSSAGVTYPSTTRPRTGTGSSIGSVQSDDHSFVEPGTVVEGTPPIAQGGRVPSLVSVSTAQGSIAQRRKTGYAAQPPPPIPSAPSRLTADALPLSTATSLGMAPGRHRAVSQPGRRPSVAGGHAGDLVDGQRPPLPAPLATSALPGMHSVTRKPSIPSTLGQSRFATGLPLNTNINITIRSADVASPAGYSNGAQTPTLTSALNSTSGYLQLQQAAIQPPPPTAPAEPLRKPFYLMSLLLVSITSKQGGFLTRRLYVPHDVWSQGGAKLTNLSEKGKCVEVLNNALEEVVTGSSEFFRGAGRASAEKWLKCLEEWTGVCDSVLNSVGKKLGVGEGIAGRKNSGVQSWGGKFTRTFDRMTSSKNFDSPSAYIYGLAKLFQAAQLFDEHIKAFSNSLTPTPYSTLPPDLRHSIEARLKRSSEFFASVVLTWVIRDLGLLLDKYVKKGEKWLEE